MEIFLHKEEPTRPFISLIVATRNEERHIGELLESLVKQTYPNSLFEVIVVDGMSKDSTLKTVEKYMKNLNLLVFSNPKIRSPSAFNKGIDEARGDLFIILGAHSVVSENFIEESVNTFLKVRTEEPKLAGVGGICINKYENYVGKITDLMYSSFFSGARSCRYKKCSHFSDSVIFGIFDKQLIVENGKFDEDFLKAGEDDELTVRLSKGGYKFFTNPKIVSQYYTRSSLKGLISQTYNYGVAKGLIVRKGNFKPEWLSIASFWFIPALFLVYEILLLFLLILSGFSISVAFVPFLIYTALNTFVTVRLFIETRKLICLILPAVYFAFHNILGLSSILGLIFGKRAFK